MSECLVDFLLVFPGGRRGEPERDISRILIKVERFIVLLRLISYAIKNQLVAKAIGGFHARKSPILGDLMP